MRTLLAVVYWFACALLTFALWLSDRFSFLTSLLLGFILPAVLVMAIAVWRYKKRQSGF